MTACVEQREHIVENRCSAAAVEKSESILFGQWKEADDCFVSFLVEFIVLVFNYRLKIDSLPVDNCLPVQIR